MIYDNLLARLVYRMEMPEADEYDHGTGLADEVQAMADELETLRGVCEEQREELDGIADMCRSALDDDDPPTWAAGLVRAVLDLYGGRPPRDEVPWDAVTRASQ